MLKEIFDLSKTYAEGLLSSDRMANLNYHNLAHTRQVASTALLLAEKAGLSEEDKFVLLTAAWFHDVGYSQITEGHEIVSAQIARDFMLSKGVSETEIKELEEIIFATAMGIIPTTKLQELMRDADSSNIGSENYFDWSEKLRKETSHLSGNSIAMEDWLTTNIAFFENHKYYSSEAKEMFLPLKSQNLTLIEKQLNNMKEDSENLVSGKQKGKKKKNKKQQIRGVETMFRVTLKNHTALSRIADNKANIMLSINAIIISVILTTLIPKLDNNTYLIWPTVLLLIVCIVSVVFATLSTMPKVTKGKTDRETIKSREANLLFFGNFYNMKLDDYTWGMTEMMKDEEYLYESLMKDLYYLGKVLHKKYKYLRICYGVFMIGITLSVLAFLISLFLMFRAPI